MHRHVGDQGAGGDIARRVTAEQGLAQRRAGEFDDIEAGRLERDADNLEVLAFARAERASAAWCPQAPSSGFSRVWLIARSSSPSASRTYSKSSSSASCSCAQHVRDRTAIADRAARSCPGDACRSCRAALGSTARTVTGRTPPSRASRIPKLAANLTSGGATSKRTASGKRSALRERPAREIDRRLRAGRPSPGSAQGRALEFQIGELGMRSSSLLPSVGALSVPSANAGVRRGPWSARPAP